MITKYLKKIFTKPDENNTYSVNLSDIEIIPHFTEHPPRPYNLDYKRNYYYLTGQFQSPIKLMNNFTLTDGYTSYCIAKELGMKKVPVQFI